MLTKNNPFNCLKGKPLSSVTFILDYYQFGFNNNRINVYSNPRLNINGKIIGHNHPEFCYLLIGLIKQKVENCILSEKESLKICFSSGNQLLLSMKPEDNPAGLDYVIEFTYDNHWWGG